MTDPTQPMDPFEQTLGRLMVDASDRALRPFDAAAIAQGLAERGPSRRTRWSRDLGTRRYLLVLAIVALAAAAVVGIVASSQQRSTEPVPSVPPSPPSGVVEPSAALTPSSTTPSSATPTTTPSPTDGGARPVIASCLGDVGTSGSGGRQPEGWATPSPRQRTHPKNGLIAGFVGTHADGTNGPNAGLVVLDPASGVVTRLADLAPDVTGRPDVAWSPLGDALAVNAGSGSGFGSCGSIDVVAGERVSHVTSMRGGAAYLWSPDGASIAVIGGGPIGIYRSDGTSVPDLVTCGDSCSFDSPMWSPDGRWLLVGRVGNDARLPSALISVATGEIADLPQSDAPADAGPLGWLDANRLLVLGSSSNGKPRFATLGLDGSTSKADVGISAMDAQTLTTAPDFSAAAGVACLRCPFVASSGGVTRTIWDGPDPISQAWSPDSRWLAFSARGGAATSGTWIVRADGTGLRRISTRVLDPIAWGPATP